MCSCKFSFLFIFLEYYSYVNCIFKINSHNDNIVSNNQQQSQQNHQIFSVNLSDDNPHFTKTKYDFDLIKNAVDIIKARSDLNYNIPATAKRNIKYPSGICHKSLNKNQKAIECSTCLNWIHRKCSGLSLKEYECLVQEDDNVPWQCILCEIEGMASKFPFGDLSKIELNDLYGLDFPSQLQLLPNYEHRSKLSHVPTLDKFDLDENYVQSINSKYFDIPEIAKLSTALSGKSFSLFHVNTRSLSKNFDQLLSVLSSLKVDLDLIKMTETKQQIGKDFLVNVDVNDYFMYTQPSKLASGGVALATCG